MSHEFGSGLAVYVKILMAVMKMLAKLWSDVKTNQAKDALLASLPSLFTEFGSSEAVGPFSSFLAIDNRVFKMLIRRPGIVAYQVKPLPMTLASQIGTVSNAGSTSNPTAC